MEEIENILETLSFRDAIQLEMGNDKILPDVGVVVSNGTWLSHMLLDLREPGRMRSAAVPKSLHATLRPYQKSGYSWLNYMNQLGFGACLADDMGLGKTVQVLAYLEKMRKSNKNAKILLVVPASLIGNWQREKEKFAPDMECCVLHGATSAKLSEKAQEELPFLSITTYGMAARLETLKEKEWDCLILDEAQAIKNPTTKQTREIKKMKSRMRIAMTGTPIENDLTNLWSLFDFLNHGLLGSSGEFREFCKGLEQHLEKYAKLKSMISPFMLRRVKTDKRIISDLPEKVELLSGNFPVGMKELFTGEHGLFPSSSEISFNCSCPDWALMCKHVAAALYGVGARLDQDPALFFTLRGIDMNRFIDVALENRVEKMLENAQKPSSRVIEGQVDITQLFGVL